MRARRPALARTVAVLVIASAVLGGAAAASGQDAAAGAPTPGTNCASYAGGVCTIDVADFYYCNANFSGSVCETVVEAGDEIVWQFSGSYHTVTDCGGDCASPTMTPFFDSGARLGGTYEFLTPFDVGAEYVYHCEFHPSQMNGRLLVLGNLPGPPDILGDVNCDGSVNSIDAALELQLGAGLLQSLDCQQNGDLNDDGTINAIDAALILQIVAGLLPP